MSYAARVINARTPCAARCSVSMSIHDDERLQGAIHALCLMIVFHFISILNIFLPYNVPATCLHREVAIRLARHVNNEGVKYIVRQELVLFFVKEKTHSTRPS